MSTITRQFKSKVSATGNYLKHTLLPGNGTRFTKEPLLQGNLLQGLRCFATTVMRGSQAGEITGYLIELNLTTGEVIAQQAIPTETESFWNARGGNRGGRGIAIYNNHIYVATAAKILIYDAHLKLQNEINHSHMAGLHEIYVDQRGIWLTSTVHDLIYQLSHDGDIINEWWGSKNEYLQEHFGFSDRPINLKLDFPAESFFQEYDQYCKDERLHINAIYPFNDEVYILASRKNAIIRISQNETLVIVQDDSLGCPHNCHITKDGRIVVNNTMHQKVNVYDLNGSLIQSIPTNITSVTEQSAQFARPGWQRGLTQVSENIFLVGTSPATIFELDINSGRVGRTFKIDDNVHHCIHGLTATYNLKG